MLINYKNSQNSYEKVYVHNSYKLLLAYHYIVSRALAMGATALSTPSLVTVSSVICRDYFFISSPSGTSFYDPNDKRHRGI